MIPAARPLAALCLFAVSACTAAGETAVPEGDRARAKKLADTAKQELGEERPGEAARLLFRAVRWDPTRVDDYRQAIELFEPVDPRAAARHAGLLLGVDPDFGRDDPKLLSRLHDVALEPGDAESLLVAGRIARRAAEVAEEEGRVLQAAQLWVKAGAAFASCDATAEASEAFDRLQRRVSGSSDDRLLGVTERWDLVASIQLAAGEAGRAAGAIALAEQMDPDSVQLPELRARLALFVDEPLAAVEHATQAIELAEQADEEPPYGVYLAAMRAVNQSDRAADRLVVDADKRPGGVSLQVAAIDALEADGRLDLAWERSTRLIERLLERFDQPADRLDEARLQLVDAVSQRVALSIAAGRQKSFFGDAERWMDALAVPQRQSEALGGAYEDEAFRDAAQRWVAMPPDKESPQSAAVLACRAGIAVESGLPELAVELTLQAAPEGSGQDELAGFAGVCLQRIEDLRRHGHGSAALGLSEWAIEFLRDRGDGAGTEVGGMIAPLIVERAAAATETGGPDAVDEATRLLEQAEREAPDDGEVAHAIVQLHVANGRFDAAIKAGERLLEHWPHSSTDGGLSAEGRRDAAVWLAQTLLSRDGAGDAERAAELLEETLDHWPDSAAALVALARCDARLESHAARADRLARRAIEKRPEWAEPWAALAESEVRRGHLPQAEALYEQAIERLDAGDSLPAWRADAIRASYAATLQAEGRAEEAATIGAE